MGQSISTTQFFLYGRSHFTQTGYLNHIKKYYKSPVQESASIRIGQEGADGVTLEGKVVVVTGANSGLGKEVATYAAAKGAKLYMLCRSNGRAAKARDEIIAATENTNVKVVLADVGELAQVRRVVEELQSEESKIDCLVCNAGVLLTERQESSDGIESTFASHLLGGSFLLPHLLMPQLKAAGDESRVIFVTSGGMLNSKFPEWEKALSIPGKFEYDGEFAYAYAKRGQVLLAEEWTKEHPEITWVSAHPGWSDTPAVDQAFGERKKYLMPLRTTWQGAEGITWLMSAKKEELQSGAFYLDRKPQRKHVAGPFFTEGSYTKNTPAEVQDMMKNLAKTADV